MFAIINPTPMILIPTIISRIIATLSASILFEPLFCPRARQISLHIFSCDSFPYKINNKTKYCEYCCSKESNPKCNHLVTFRKNKSRSFICSGLSSIVLNSSESNQRTSSMSSPAIASPTNPTVINKQVLTE